MMGMFMQEPSPAFGFDFGDEVTYSWPGGLDIGPFSTPVQLPGTIAFTSPEITTSEWGQYSVDIDLDSDLALAWNADQPGDLVIVSVSSMVYEGDIPQSGSVTCMLVDDGSHVIPASLLSQLPQSDQHAHVTFFAIRYSVSVIAVPLTHGGNGWVTVMAGSSVTASDWK